MITILLNILHILGKKGQTKLVLAHHMTDNVWQQRARNHMDD